MRAWGERHLVAVKRLQNILRSHGVANARVLEQKISDAGPGPQRVDPHILTDVRIRLMAAGTILARRVSNMPWYYLATTPLDTVDARLALLVPLQQEAQAASGLVGQSLEIAVLRALKESNLEYFGDYLDLDAHDDSTLYSKEEPPASISGRRIPGKKLLDFLVLHHDAGYAGIEVKNVREWFYPQREEVKEVLLKCCALNVVPVLIARRIHFSAFSVLNPCGVIIHQTFNQLYPNAESDLAARLRRKDLLGFHDIRVIDADDAASTHDRLRTFFTDNLAGLLPAARVAFDEYKDLLCGYANGTYAYAEFAARVKRRQRGEPEGFDDEPEIDAPVEW